MQTFKCNISSWLKQTVYILYITTLSGTVHTASRQWFITLTWTTTKRNSCIMYVLHLKLRSLRHLLKVYYTESAMMQPSKINHFSGCSTPVCFQENPLPYEPASPVHTRHRKSKSKKQNQSSNRIQRDSAA